MLQQQKSDAQNKKKHRELGDISPANHRFIHLKWLSVRNNIFCQSFSLVLVRVP